MKELTSAETDSSFDEGNSFNCESQAESQNFTIILNDAIRDSRLSWRAKGILAGCLSHNRNFLFNKAWIIQHGTEGRDAVSSALGELRALGYLEGRVDRCKASGRVIGERLIFRDRGHRHTEKPDAGKPGAGKPGAGKPVVFRRPIEEDQKKEEQETRQAPSGLPEGWQTLPVAPARKSKKFVIDEESIPLKLEPVAKLVCIFFNKHKGGQKTKQALDGLITNLVRIAEDPGGGMDHVKKQLEEAIEKSSMGEKKWISITYSNWERFAKTSKPKWDQVNTRPATSELLTKHKDDAPAVLMLS